ncbi:WxL domain-containing protein [Candidatus Enterococcus courvalinii]|uniref:WxL domain-containing protein n=1 Tax=Candidatus Enterococcus courvalinii TaxID=2815329 RepID=A0ABS3HZP8_9ENTE|nr:WxL domain-containing protein [Enterococcus sp. MSG2901]MBO0481392.1 WxL domain-containing protein [Enterococcus sp. MSG2901]
MKSIKLFSTFTLIATFVGIGVQVSAATYDGPLDANSSVTAEITIPPVDPGNPEIPPVDPGEPEPPIDPGEMNPDRGDGLSIRYVSSLDFGSAEFSTQAQRLTAKPDSGIDEELEEQEFENMVTVEDIRGERDGWTLTVRQATEFMNGSVMSINPHVVENDFGVTTASGSLIVNTEDEVFAQADNQEADAGVISMGMGNVTLDVPARAGVGAYETTLMWNLTNGPE